MIDFEKRQCHDCSMNAFHNSAMINNLDDFSILQCILRLITKVI